MNTNTDNRQRNEGEEREGRGGERRERRGKEGRGEERRGGRGEEGRGEGDLAYPCHS